MKIAYSLSVFSVPGGTERMISAQANWFAAHGYDVALILKNQEGKPLAFSLDERIKVVDLKVSEPISRRFPWHCAGLKAYRKKMAEHLMSAHYDIVLTTNISENIYFLPNIKDGSKKIIEFHASIFLDRMLSAQQRWTARLNAKLKERILVRNVRKCSHVVAISKADFEEWNRLASNAVRIPNVITVEPSAISTCDNKEVIAAGRIDRLKGFEYLLDAWALVLQRHPDWHLSIYGGVYTKSPYSKELADQVVRLHLPADTFKGNTDNIAARYAESSIIVCSSRSESFSLVIVEAAACGVPAVSFDCPTGPRDIIEDGKTGFLVPKVGDVQGMAKALCRLIEDDALRKQMGAAAREASQRFSVDNVMHQWEQLFAEVLNEK